MPPHQPLINLIRYIKVLSFSAQEERKRITAHLEKDSKSVTFLQEAGVLKQQLAVLKFKERLRLMGQIRCKHWTSVQQLPESNNLQETNPC